MDRLQKSLFLCLFLMFYSITSIAGSVEKDVRKAYNSWCKSIGEAKDKNPSEIVKHYAADAILLPTLSPKILMNKNGQLEAYFTKLLSNQNIKCNPEKLITRMYGDIAINSGLYSFSYKEDGKKVTLPARFTFVYKKSDDGWKIVNHHSSKLPS